MLRALCMATRVWPGPRDEGDLARFGQPQPELPIRRREDGIINPGADVRRSADGRRVEHVIGAGQF